MADEKNEKENKDEYVEEPEVEQQAEEKSNVCGVIGLLVSWIVPLAGFILGIVALSRNERTKALGILAIIVSVVFWIMNIFYYI